MNRILTKALMKYHNDFFIMTKEEQDVWKLQDHDEIDKKVNDFIIKSLGLVGDEDDRMSPEDTFTFNVTMLPYRGIGDNNFMLNEFNWNEKILKHKTLYDYNVEDHEYQENAYKDDENFSNYEPTALYNRIAAWARAEIDGKFNYLNLTAIQWHTQWALDEISFDFLEKEIPHDYVDGPDNGKKVENGYLWDMKLDAKGLEGWYEQMTDFSHEYLSDVFDKHVDNELFTKVYILDKDDGDLDPGKDFIFGNMEVLKQLTFINFIDDCEKVRGDNAEIEAYLSKVENDFKDALAAKLIEVKKTAPNVVKFKKKNTIVMADNVLDDLLNNLEDE